MAGDNNTGKKGFSGLSELVSEVDLPDEPQKQTNTTEASPPPPRVDQPQPKEVAPTPQRHSTSSTRPIETASSGKSDNGSTGKWVLVGIGVCFVIWLVTSGGQNNRVYSPPPASAPQSYNAPQSSQTPAATPPSTPSTPRVAPNVTQSSGLQYAKPSVGTNNLLSVPEIQWCLRESIRIEAMRDLIDTNAGISEFNRIVNDWNSRCGSYRYREGAQSQAERSIEPYRSQIVAEAACEAKQLGRPYQPSSPPASSVPSTSNVPAKPAEGGTPEKSSTQYIKEAQQLLTDLGYKPGPADGAYGRRTAEAVKAFQRKAGITQDGQIDEGLLRALRRAKAEYKPPVAPQAQNETRSQPRPAPDTASANYFTRGSHQDDVLRVQGTPSSIDKYSNYEIWNYSYSTVKISAGGRRVIEWNNISSNLRVRMTPGLNVTNTPYFTRGSHQDDVLRVQGTPSSIDKYSNYEVWSYSYSTVKISLEDRRVIEWNNISGNLKARMTPGSNVTNTPYFTRGSHQDDVLRVQGTPSSIDKYSNYEVWSYSYSTVKISSGNRCVTEWNNISGNLKVRMNPGSNVTNTPYFTRGSHQDDVLRVQGTPSSIDKYSNYEVWSYSYSTVKISLRDLRVTEWNNISSNLKVR